MQWNKPGRGVLLLTGLILCGWPGPTDGQIERRSLEPLDVPAQQPAPQTPSQGYGQQDYGQPQTGGQGWQDHGQPSGPSIGQTFDEYGQPPSGGGYQQDPGAPTSLIPPGVGGSPQDPSTSQNQPAYDGTPSGSQFSQPNYDGEQQPSYGEQQPGFYGDSSYAPQASYGNPSSDQSPMPADVWSDIDGATLQRLLSGANLPSSSPTLSDLIARALAADPPQGGQETAIRVSALERAGRTEEIVQLLGPAAQSGDPGIAARYGLALLAADRDQEACSLNLGDVPQTARPDSDVTRAALLIPAYCAALQGNAQAAAQALQAAQQRGVTSQVASAVIDQLSQGSTERPPVPSTLDVLDYVFLQLGKVALPASLAKSANPTLLYRLARDSQASPELRLVAAERGAALHIVDGKVLREAYEQAAPQLGGEASAPYALRAKLFVNLQKASSAAYRAESIDALLASGKDAGIQFELAKALVPENTKLAQDPSAAKFAETGVRIAILAGDDQSAWDWIERGGQAARSWPLLVAIGDPFSPRAAEALDSGATIASQTGLPSPVLHRLITVLDSLNYEVPIPLWDMASKSEQPSDGYLPERGVLTDLQKASEAGEVGKTVLLVAAALGPDGPSGANLIALGDSVRALRQVGLEAEARRIGFEALYPRWPFQGKA